MRRSRMCATGAWAGSAGTWGLRAKGTAARWQAWQRRQGGGDYDDDVDGAAERVLRADGGIEDVGLL